MIDEKKLIDRLNDKDDFKMSFEISKEHFETVKRVCEAYHKKVCEFIEEQPKIGEWIPCSEQLPEESLNAVIGWDEYRKRCCFVLYYGKRWHLGNDYDSVKITAWQPVPEAYKG